MKQFVYVFLMISLASLISCGVPHNNTDKGADKATEKLPELPEPTKEFALPYELREISGLVWIDNHTIASVQDENGIIYLIDANIGQVKDKINFGKDGDYEGITLVNDTYFVVRSDGDIFEVSADGDTKKYKFKDSAGFNFEGLCYDKSKNRLLVACKEHPKKKHKKEVLIYEFDLETKKYKRLTFKLKQKDLEGHFKPSGIAIYNHQIYLLSFTAQKLAVLSSEGEILKQLHLPASTFAQPEGITFDTDGNLYISNEVNGHFSEAKLLKFTALK